MKETGSIIFLFDLVQPGITAPEVMGYLMLDYPLYLGGNLGVTVACSLNRLLEDGYFIG